ncbi:hypothetical protein H2200_007682 [Cladophialophora chaetospira]|uniref:F-box domain-containing protein n=1 Tax=Cladophialophora chaetospira TaxID=386627 RepID=A0AA39CGN0_9EURO|nr:hypothetical protein H2200_007682 [Cladophialophora chaetospira]
MDSNITKLLNPARLLAEEFQFLTKKPYYNNLLIDSHELAKRVSLGDPRQWTVAKRPCASLGTLGTLPAELQFQVFSVTAISTLFDLRATNSHAKQLIEQWQPFRTVMTHGANVVRALLTTGAGNLWTTEQVVDVILTTDCEFCGEHGEILQLLKLKRCCFRCLSQERDLLAVSERYACTVMKLTRDELAALPLLRSVPQKEFWGFPVQQRGWAFDYKAALGILRKRPRQQVHRPSAPSAMGRLELKPTGKQLTLKERSVQPRPQSTIQSRRGQRPLRLLGEEVSPLETVYTQHACAIRAPGKSRQIFRHPEGGLRTGITTVEAYHCAGCAFYWNYHSPLPWQFHRLLPHQKGKKDTPLTRHLNHCVYARLQWFWVYNPWRELHPEDIILRNSGNIVQSRSGEDLGPKENARFEEVPEHVLTFLETTELDSTTFQPQYTWPKLKSDEDKSYDDNRRSNRQEELLFQRIREREAPSPIEMPDDYYDCLVSQEAVSQANWACANLSSGRVGLFGGPVTVMVQKHEKLDRRGCRLPAIGLSEIYLD